MTEKSGKVIWLYPYSAAECWLKGVLVWGMALLLACPTVWLLVPGLLRPGRAWPGKLVGGVLLLLCGILAWKLLERWWRELTAEKILRLDVVRGVLLQGYWRWGWRELSEYPISAFAAVSGERIHNVYLGWGSYERLWLAGEDGQHDLMIAECAASRGLNKLEAVQYKISRYTGLPRVPIGSRER